MKAAALAGGAWSKQWRRWAPVAVLVGLCIIIGLFNPNFFGGANFVRMLNTAAIPLVICMGVTFVILMGSIDLSAEGVIAICAVIVSLHAGRERFHRNGHRPLGSVPAGDARRRPDRACSTASSTSNSAFRPS